MFIEAIPSIAFAVFRLRISWIAKVRRLSGSEFAVSLCHLESYSSDIHNARGSAQRLVNTRKSVGTYDFSRNISNAFVEKHVLKLWKTVAQI